MAGRWLLALLAAAAACAPPPGRDAREVAMARRLEVRVEAPAMPDAAASEAGPAEPVAPPPPGAFASMPLVSLPDRLGPETRAHLQQVWYQADLTLPGAPAVPWAVLVPRVSMNAAVYVGDTLVGQGGPFAPHTARVWNRPLLFDVPPGLLAAGSNRLTVRVAVAPYAPVLLAPFFVGPEAALRPTFEARTFWQVTMPQIGALLNLAIGLAAGLVWLRRRQLSAFGWFAAANAAWAIGMLDTFVREPPLPPALWQWTTSTGGAASVACFVMNAHRHLELVRPAAERWALGTALAGAVALAVALWFGSPLGVAVAMGAWGVATAAVGVYLVRLLGRLRREGAGRPTPVPVLLGAAGAAVGTHDVLLVAGVGIAPPVMLLPLLGPLVAVWGGWRMVDRFVGALADAEALNRDLERRVAERGDEIARSYEQIRRLERDQLVAAERDRLMRDIHDGLGGQLTSTLALVETEAVPRDEIADAIRDALDDMRLLIASLAPTEDDLLVLLGTLRGRLEPRLARRGIHFDWQVSDLPPVAWLGPQEALQVLRIFQEAVTNVLKHADATTIVVRTGTRDGGILVEIADDGRGLGAGGGDGGGFGLGNMRQRAAALGGRLVVAVNGVGGAGASVAAARGTRVELWLPIAR